MAINDARRKVASHINATMTKAYWQIGKYIVEYEQGGQAKVAYGTSTLTELSHQLTARFGRGFCRPNLVNMRKFYLVYPNCQTVSDNLTWSHIGELIIIDDNLERGFYEKECIAQKWDVRTLRRQMSSALYLRLAASKDKEGVLALAKEGITAENIPYVVLVDINSVSMAEIEPMVIKSLFPTAYIVGERTYGGTGPLQNDVESLNYGAPFGDYNLSHHYVYTSTFEALMNGAVLEGIGIVPDEEVLRKDDPSHSFKPQLDAALQYIRNH